MPGSDPVTVITVDDQKTFLSAARRLIEAADGFALVGEAACGGDAVKAAAALHPDLVLVDVRMGDMDGVETARRIAAVAPSTTVVLMSLEDPADLPSLRRAPGVPHVRKQDLSIKTLERVWRQHGGRRAPA